MKKKLFILLSLVLIPSLLFAWTEPTGSTFTVTTGESQEVKDILNDAHDVTHAALTVYNISTGPYNTLTWVWNGSTWTILETSINNMDGVGVSSPSLNTKTFLYAYNGTSWDRVRSTKDMFLEVRTASGSIIYSLVMPCTNYITESQFFELTKHSTYYLTVSQFNELTQHPTTFMNISQFSELTEHTTDFLNISQYDELRAHATEYLSLSQFYELTQHSTYFWTLSQFTAITNQLSEIAGHTTNFMNIGQFDELRKNATDYINGGVIDQIRKINSVDESTACVRGGILDEILRILQSTATIRGGQLDEVLRVLQSTTTIRGGQLDEILRVLESSCVVKNFPADYPDGTAQSSLSSIDSQLASGTTISYQVLDSTYVYKDFYENGTWTVNFNIKSIGVYSQGGDSTLNWDGGDNIKIWDGIPFGDVPIDETFSKPVTLTFTLTSPTTFSVYLRGRL